MADPVSQNTNGAAQTTHIRTYAADVARLTGKPLPKDVKNVPAPPPPPREPPPARIIPKAPSTQESKEEVLARLRARTAAQVEAPPAASVIPDAPSTNESREAVLRRLRQNAPAAAATPPAVPAETPAPSARPVATRETASPIHTYKSDFSARAGAEGAGRIAILAAEQDAGTPAPQAVPEKKKGGALVVAAGALLILAGVLSVYGAYRFAIGNRPVPPELFVPSLIFADERVALSGSAEELRARITGTELADLLSEGEAAIVYLAYATTTDAGVVERAAGGDELLRALSLPAPDLLLRNIGPRSTLGVLRIGAEARPFFILEASSFDRTFAAMLSWEPTLGRDLAQFYPELPAPLPAVPEGEASTTEPIAKTARAVQAAPIRRSFIDEVIANRDARVLRDADNRPVLLYGYYDRDTLIIARSPDAFAELVRRLSSSRAR